MTTGGTHGRRINVSLVIAALLVTSGLVRLAGGTGAAIATEIASMTAPSQAAAPPAEAGSAAERIDAILAGLRAQEAELARRAETLDERERDLDEARALIDDKLAELREAEASLEDMIALAETASEGDVAQLTSVYENMKPKEAAVIFEEMAPEFAAGFLGRMRPDAAARIFAGLEPPTAYAISVILAGRNADLATP